MKLKTHQPQSSYGLLKKSVYSSVPLSMLLAAIPARAQMGLTDEMANQSATQARARQAQQTDYTFKSGDFRMLLQPSLSMQWNDNINCTGTGQENDFIILPILGVNMSYPLTRENLLQLNVSAGYSEYLRHPHLSSWYLQSGSGLSFNLYIKDILVNLHDQFSYAQNTSENPDIAGTGTSGIFQNSAGLSGQWSLKYINFTVGYDHENYMSTSSQFDDINNETESAYTRIGYQWNPKFTTGVEGTVSYTSYDENTLNNNASYSAGVYAEWRPDTFLDVKPRIGYAIDQFGQSSQFLQTQNLESWYADLAITHGITRSLSYTVDAGHAISPGMQSDANEYWYANGGITWNFIKGFSLQPQFYYQHGNQGIGSTILPTSIPSEFPSTLISDEIYNWYGGSIGLNYTITKRFTMGWTYSFTQRSSSLSGRGYTQNIIGVQFTYHPI